MTGQPGLPHAPGPGWSPYRKGIPAVSMPGISSVAAAVSSVPLLGSRSGRSGVVIVNDGAAILYVAYAPVASLTAFTYKVPPGAVLEMAQPVYSGPISGIWSSADGSARITELY